MLLSGHEGEVYCCKFHPNGATLASSGYDRLIRESHDFYYFRLLY